MADVYDLSVPGVALRRLAHEAADLSRLEHSTQEATSSMYTLQKPLVVQPASAVFIMRWKTAGRAVGFATVHIRTILYSDSYEFRLSGEVRL